MKFITSRRRVFAAKQENTVVTFTGGMGAQIIGASVYFLLKDAGQSVYADLSYFNYPERVAVAGNAGQVSHWAWQLHHFGLHASSFDRPPALPHAKPTVLCDGPRKLELCLQALGKPEIRRLFEVPDNVNDVLPTEFQDRFLCMHVRRGDYVNVAGHLIGHGDFVRVAAKFAGLADHVVVLSDSPIELDFRTAVSPLFKEVLFLDDIDTFAAHRIMRSASILICSNSTFSLTAAVLNPNALAIVPKQWYEGSDRQVEAAIHARCSFQIMGNDGGAAGSAGEP